MCPRRRSGASALAWALWGSWAALTVLTALLVWRGPSNSDGTFGFMLVGYATVGALVTSRQPRNAVGWLLIVLALAVALQLAGDAYASSGTQPGYRAVAWFAGWGWYAWLFLVAVFIPLLFPDGRLPSQRWRPVNWLGLAGLVVCMIGAAFRPGPLEVEAQVQNPVGARGTAAEVFAAIETLGGVILILAVLLTALSLVVRFRHSAGVERQQLKWFSFAAIFSLGGLILAGVDAMSGAPWVGPIGGVGWFMFIFGSFVGIPVAAGVAISRYRLYDIDLVINKALVYGALTAALVATYVVTVLVLRLMLSPVTGDSALAVAGSTLAVAGFLCAAADETVQPTHVTLWIRP